MHDTDDNPFIKAGSVVSSDLAAIIIDFAAPMLQHTTTFAAREEAVSYAVVAWNLSLEKPDVREQARIDLEQMLEPEQREQIHQLIDFLLQRKQEKYPDNRFYIIDYDLTPRGAKMEIRVETKYIPRSA
jgi:hypothetical protein